MTGRRSCRDSLGGGGRVTRAPRVRVSARVGTWGAGHGTCGATLRPQAALLRVSLLGSHDLLYVIGQISPLPSARPPLVISSARPPRHVICAAPCIYCASPRRPSSHSPPRSTHRAAPPPPTEPHTMPFRARAKRLFTRSRATDPTAPTVRWPSNVYRPDEPLPGPKKTPAPPKEHTTQLEAFSFAAAEHDNAPPAKDADKLAPGGLTPGAPALTPGLSPGASPRLAPQSAPRSPAHSRPQSRAQSPGDRRGSGGSARAEESPKGA